VTPQQGVQRLRHLQRELVESTRPRIPAIVHEECLTGFTTYHATVYPTALAWAATFGPGLVKEMASAIGRDIAAVSVYQGLSPVLAWFVTTDGSRGTSSFEYLQGYARPLSVAALWFSERLPWADCGLASLRR
jgi:beta-glucosidase-like glycosyl hydrolase